MRRGNSQRADFPQMKYLEELQREELHLEGQMLLPEVETLEFVKEGRGIVIYGNTNLLYLCSTRSEWYTF